MSAFATLMDRAPIYLSHETRVSLAHTAMEIMGYHRYEYEGDTNKRLPWCGINGPLAIALHELLTWEPEAGYDKEFCSLSAKVHRLDEPELQLNDTLAYPLFVAGKPLTRSWVGKRTGKTYTGRAVDKKTLEWINKKTLGAILANPVEWTEFESLVQEAKDLLEKLKRDTPPSKEEVVQSLVKSSPLGKDLHKHVFADYVDTIYKELKFTSDADFETEENDLLRDLAKRLLAWYPPSGYSLLYADRAAQSNWSDSQDVQLQLLNLNNPKQYWDITKPDHTHKTLSSNPIAILESTHAYFSFNWKDEARSMRSRQERVREALGKPTIY